MSKRTKNFMFDYVWEKWITPFRLSKFVRCLNQNSFFYCEQALPQSIPIRPSTGILDRLRILGNPIYYQKMQM